MLGVVRGVSTSDSRAFVRRTSSVFGPGQVGFLSALLLIAVGASASTQAQTQSMPTVPEGYRSRPAETPSPPTPDSADALGNTPMPATAPTSGDSSASSPTSPPPARVQAAPIPRTASSVTVTSTGEVRIPPRILRRLRVLDADLSTLGARGSNGLLEGVLSGVTGGVSIALGAIIDAPPAFALYLYIYGGSSVARGFVQLFLTPNAADDAVAFAHLPMETIRDVRTRLRFGELRLEALADRQRLVRILDGSINLAAGLAFIPLYLAPNSFSFKNPYDYLLLVGAGVSLLTGTIMLFQTTDSERRWSAYAELRQRLREERLRETDSTGDGDASASRIAPTDNDVRQARARALANPTWTAGAAITPNAGMVSLAHSF